MPKTAAGPSGVMYPNPVLLITTGHGDEANILTVSWAGTVCGNPWMVAFSARPATWSHGLLMKYRECVLNIPTVHMMAAVSICGSRSGRDGSKWEAAGLHPDASEVIETPGITECPISLECRIRHTMDLGLHTMFVAEVVKMRRDPEWLLNPPPPVFVEGKYYTLTGEPLKVSELGGRQI